MWASLRTIWNYFNYTVASNGAPVIKLNKSILSMFLSCPGFEASCVLCHLPFIFKYFSSMFSGCFIPILIRRPINNNHNSNRIIYTVTIINSNRINYEVTIINSNQHEFCILKYQIIKKDGAAIALANRYNYWLVWRYWVKKSP